MIKSSNLTRLPILSFYQVVKDILSGVKILAFTDAGLQALVVDMTHVFGDFDESVRRVRSSVHTENLNALDGQRDALLVGIGGLLRSYQYINDAAKKDAARLLQGYYETYGEQLARLPQKEETAAIANLLQDFALPPSVSALALLPFLNDWIAPLREANIEFERLSNTRNAETMIAEAGLSKKFRQKLQDLLHDFASRINAVLLLSNNTDATAQKAADVVNAAVQAALHSYRPGGGRESDV